MSGIFGGSVPLGDTTPKAESNSPTAGTMPSSAPMDHQHPRLTSTTAHVLDTLGEATVNFTRAFAPVASTPTTPWPGVACLLVEGSDNQPVFFKVKSWTTDGSGNYTGCVIKGMRSQMLPPMVAVSGLLTAVITGVNNVISQLTSYNVFGGVASGAAFTCIVVQRS